MVLVVPDGPARRPQAEADQREPRVKRTHARDGLEPVGHPLPGVLVVQHQHARGVRHAHGRKQLRIDGRHESLGRLPELVAHDVREPGRDDDLPEREPVGSVDLGGGAVVETLVVLDQVELRAARGRRGRGDQGRLPGGGDEDIAQGEAVGTPAGRPGDTGPEPRHPLGPRPGEATPERAEAPAGRDDHGDRVTEAGEPIGVRQDRPHATRDPEMRTEEGDTHQMAIDTCPGRR